nr:hypothetical protein [Nostoc sp. EkiNYC01]
MTRLENTRYRGLALSERKCVSKSCHAVRVSVSEREGFTLRTQVRLVEKHRFFGQKTLLLADS